MSYKARTAIQKDFEIGFLKTLSLDEINDMFRQLYADKKELELKLAQTESPRSPGCSTAGDDIISTVFQFIDRMNDPVDTDNAERILSEFTKEIAPHINQYIADGSR
mgnify:CR=1 FL=1